MNLSSAVRTGKSVITANSPVLLVGTAIVGVITTGVLAARGGYKARGIIDEAAAAKDDAKGEDLTSQEMIQLTWLCYAGPVLTGASAIAAVVGVHTIHTKRHAALAGLYAITSHKLDDYREKAEELLGTKKTQQLNNAVGQAAIDRDPLTEDREVYILDEGNQLFYDDWSGRYFMGSMSIIEKALGTINTRLAGSGDASLNEFYDEVGLPPVQSGKDFGWSGGKVEITFGSVQTKDGRSAISIWFQQEPKENLGIVR
jgi:Family of unknown function (DUF6353)